MSIFDWLRRGGQNPPEEASAADAAEWARQVGLPEDAVAALLREGTAPERLMGRDEEYEPVEAAGLSVEVRGDRSREVVARLRETLGPEYHVFLSRQGLFGDRLDRVALLRGEERWLPVRVMGTNGANYDVWNDDVLRRLDEWDARFGLVLTGAGDDWLQADFRTPPPDMAAFAAEVYEFCPDVVDQGTETVEALEKEMTVHNTVYLWWD